MCSLSKKIRRIPCYLFFFFATLVTFSPAFLADLRAEKNDLTVFAAASLSDALDEIAREYAKSGAAGKISFNFAASSTLSRQIREGASADLFISADNAQMDTLAARDLLALDTRRPLVANTLVIVVPAENARAMINAPDDLLTPAVRRLALGETNTVPAGVYARAWLTRINLWDKLAASEKIIPCENVRAALAAIESGNADVAIVYHTDALSSKKVRIALKISANETPEITYPVAILKNAPHADFAQKFAAYLFTQEVQKIFNNHGFITTEK